MKTKKETFCSIRQKNITKATCLREIKNTQPSQLANCRKCLHNMFDQEMKAKSK